MVQKIKVQDPGPTRSPRPDYHCKKCDRNFPNILDMEEHRRLDHGITKTASAE